MPPKSNNSDIYGKFKGFLSKQGNKNVNDKEEQEQEEHEEDVVEEERRESVSSPGDLIPLGLKLQIQTGNQDFSGVNESLEEDQGYLGSIESFNHQQQNSSTENQSQSILQDPNSLASIQTSNDCSVCSSLREELANTKLKFEGLMTMQHEWEAGKMHRRLTLMQDELEEKESDLTKMRLDMEILGQKLIDEIEKRAEITAANESVQGELEELTQTLFEEANTLVANEARQRHGAQEKQQVLSKQLQEVKLHLQLEQAQNKELRVRIAQFEQDRENANSKASRSDRLSLSVSDQQIARLSLRSSDHKLNQKQSSSVTSLNPVELIDPFLFEQFVELIERAPRVKMTKIHDIPFMHSSLDDDVTPCLRFGGNPRTSTRKFIDAIVANTCFIELMSEEQIHELEERDERIRRSSILSLDSPDSSLSKNNTPTISIFNKTVLERITNALTAPTPTIGGRDSYSDHEGCATCGRLESYKYRFKISDIQQDVWYPICSDCRFRLLSVLDFYQFIRNMRQGLFSTRAPRDLYLETLCYKRVMFFSRIGCGGIRDVDSLFHILDPVRPDSSIMNSIEEVVTGPLQDGENEEQ